MSAKSNLIYIVIIIGLVICSLINFKSCKPLQKETVLIDSSIVIELYRKNAEFDSLGALYQTNQIKTSKWIDSLNKVLKKPIIRYKQLKSYYTDTIYQNIFQTCDSIIFIKDSIIFYYQVLDTTLKLENLTLKAKMQLNNEFAERSKGLLEYYMDRNKKFKHLVWRLYRLRK
jgi:hypothetical protein